MNFLFVALGGALGAMLRYAISLLPFRGSFPTATLLANLLGALLIGFLVGTAGRRAVSAPTMLLLKTGLCGGFTTFSTFSLESLTMVQKGNTPLAILYMVLSVTLCLLGVWAGMALSRLVCGQR